MNKDRRKQIAAASADLDSIKSEIDALAAEEQTQGQTDEEMLASKEENWSSRIEDIKSDLESVRDEEQDYYDNMPEGLQAGERGCAAETAVEKLNDTLEVLEEMLNCEEVGQLVGLFHEKYDELVDNLGEAQG